MGAGGAAVNASGGAGWNADVAVWPPKYAIPSG